MHRVCLESFCHLALVNMAEVSTTVNAGSSVITVMADDADSDEFGTVSS